MVKTEEIVAHESEQLRKVKPKTLETKYSKLYTDKIRKEYSATASHSPNMPASPNSASMNNFKYAKDQSSSHLELYDPIDYNTPTLNITQVPSPQNLNTIPITQELPPTYPIPTDEDHFAELSSDDGQPVNINVPT